MVIRIDYVTKVSIYIRNVFIQSRRVTENHQYSGWQRYLCRIISLQKIETGGSQQFLNKARKVRSKRNIRCNEMYLIMTLQQATLRQRGYVKQIEEIQYRESICSETFKNIRPEHVSVAFSVIPEALKYVRLLSHCTKERLAEQDKAAPTASEKTSTDGII